MMEQITGAKYDEGKPRPSLVPVEAIEAIMHVREFGKAKYADAEDWRKVPREKWLDALLRHVLHIWDNPLALDYESGLPALWHVITNAAIQRPSRTTVTILYRARPYRMDADILIASADISALAM